MPSPDTGVVITPLNDVQENVRLFSQDEAVWLCFTKKRALRKRLSRMLRKLNSHPPLTEEQFDQLDWLAAEREARPIHAIGKWIDS